MWNAEFPFILFIFRILFLFSEKFLILYGSVSLKNSESFKNGLIELSYSLSTGGQTNDKLV